MTKIVVTGAAGFLGSHLIDALVDAGEIVTGIDNLHRGSLENVRRHLESGALRFVQEDIRDYVMVRQTLEGANVVFHLAAQSNVMGAATDPEYSFTTNVLGTYNVLRASAELGVDKLVFSSSREAYGEPGSLPVSETHATQPKNMYGASKLAGEAYCRAFASTSDLCCTVLRFGNIYGPRDRDRVIPIWLANAALGKPLSLYGGHQVLDFINVRYAVSALLAAAHCDSFGPINVASGKGTTLKSLAVRILTASGSASHLRIEPARAIEVTRFVADVAQMRDCLRVLPPEDPLDGLEELVSSPLAD